MSREVLVVDTAGHDASVYLSLGAVDVLGVERWVDAPVERLAAEVSRYRRVLVVICDALLARVIESEVAEKLLDLLELVGLSEDRVVGLFFPTAAPGEAVALFLDALGVDDLEFLAEAERFLRHPFGWPEGSLPYDTTLLPACSREMPPLELGALWRDRLLIGNADVLTFSSITESFRICPLDPVLIERLELQRAKQLPAPPVLSPPPVLARPGLRKTAWMEILLYEEDGPRDLQERLVDWILRARLDALWISISPNQYYSPIARLAANTSRMHGAIARFTRLLSTEALARGMPLPKILVSVHIANNYFKPQPQPSRIAWDLWGNEYPDIPDPLDEEFWETEVAAPVEALAQSWTEHAVGMALEGIVIDLEMYLRHLTGMTEFSGTMGLRSGAELARVENYAESLGRRLRARYRAAIPGCILACYAATISLDWFYRGLYRGLSAPDDPLELYTFASRAHPHEALLAARGIHARHHGVLMLSKIRSEAEFPLAAKILSQNTGLWLNRLSRVEPHDPTRWHRLEQLPLDADGRGRFMDYLGTL